MPWADLNARGPPRAEIPSGLTGQPANQHASTPANRPPDMAARESSKAPNTGQTGTGPGGPTPGAGHAADPPPPPAHEAQTAGHAGTPASTAPAHRNDKGTPGDATSREAPTQGPPQAHAESATRATSPNTPKRLTNQGLSLGGHTRDDSSFDASMVSCKSASQTGLAPTAPRSQPEPRGDHTEPDRGCQVNPLRCSARHTSSAITPPGGRRLSTPPPRMTSTRPQARQRTRPQTNRPGTAPKGAERVWRQAPTPLAGLPNSHRGPPQPGGGGIWTRRARKATRAATTPKQNRRQPKTWTCGSPGSPHGASRPGSQHPMAAYFMPARGWNPHHGGRRHRPSGSTARTPRHHGPPKLVALGGLPAHGACGDL